VRALKCIQLFSLALFVAGLANANRLETDDSQYGFAPTDIAPVVFTPGVLLTQQTFFQTQSTVQIFDFKINTNITNFALTLTGDVPFANNGNAFGAFSVCTNVTHGDATEIVQCGPNPAAQGVTFTPDDLAVTDSTRVVTFTIPGSCEGCVFFAAENQTGARPFSVQASVAFATPEPRSWLLLASGLLILALQRRRLTRLLQPGSFRRD